MQHNECFERSKNIYHTSEVKLRVIFLRGIEQSLITQNVITESWMTLDASQVTTTILFFLSYLLERKTNQKKNFNFPTKNRICNYRNKFMYY